MVRKCCCLVGILYIILTMGMQVSAADQCGTLRIIPVWCGSLVAGGTVSLYRVGQESGQILQITDGLANWCLEDADLKSEYWVQWMLNRKGRPFQTTCVELEAGALFENLPEGIYLVEQSEAPLNFAAFQPFFQRIPENGNWDLSVNPRVMYTGEPPQTGDHPAPIIAAMGIGLSAAILMVMADDWKE